MALVRCAMSSKVTYLEPKADLRNNTVTAHRPRVQRMSELQRRGHAGAPRLTGAHIAAIIISAMAVVAVLVSWLVNMVVTTANKSAERSHEIAMELAKNAPPPAAEDINMTLVWACVYLGSFVGAIGAGLWACNGMPKP